MVWRRLGSRGGLLRSRGARRQRLLPAFERSARRERRFKQSILVLTGLCVLGLLTGTPTGRHVSTSLMRRLKWTLQGLVGLEPGRDEVDADWRAHRRRGIEQTRQTYRDYFEHDASPGLRRILRAAKMAPDEVLLRWANVDWTIILSPLVFAPDDHGRAYRMRPNTRSFWLREHTLTRGLVSFFFLPDTPYVRAVVAEEKAAIMPESYQTTNSWGFRGPEPDLDAPLRVLVLGDSFMQGLFVLDDETPPEHLRRHLESSRSEAVSVLNTGHIGYSPEQYYHTLREVYDRFRPSFVVVSVCPNDFGDRFAVMEGQGDWDEAGYWLDAIHQFCVSRQTPCLLVAVPMEDQVTKHRNEGYYPGPVANLWTENGPYYLDPADDFIDEHLHLVAEKMRRDRRPQTSPLYNGHIHDAHFSPRGAAVWGQVVGRRIGLLLDYHEAGAQEHLRTADDP